MIVFFVNNFRKIPRFLSDVFYFVRAKYVDIIRTKVYKYKWVEVTCIIFQHLKLIIEPVYRLQCKPERGSSVDGLFLLYDKNVMEEL